jgi:N-acetylneuraminic acid mutarotase
MERAPVPYNAGGIFAVSDGTYIYAGGGTDLANLIVHNDLLRYDPVNDSWTTLATGDPHALSQAVYFNGKIYNMGGYDESFLATDTTRIYDIATNTWTTGTPMPQALTQMATAMWNGVIYVAGGNLSFGQLVNTLYAYDINSDTWTALAAMPQPLTLPGFGAINGKIYIAGGFGNGGILDTLYIYDIATNAWTPGANLSQFVEGPGTSVFNGLLYVYGGRLPGLILSNLTRIYDPASNTWSDGPNLKAAKYAMYGTAVGNDSIVAPGGLLANLVGLSDNQQLITMPCPTPRPRPTPHPRP